MTLNEDHIGLSPEEKQIVKKIEKKYKVTQRVMIQRHEQIKLLKSVRNMQELIFIRLGIYSGLRIGEICKLAPVDLDLERDVIHIRLSKGGKSRYACCDRATLTMLSAIAQDCRMEPKEPYIKVSARTLERWFKDLCHIALGHERYVPHCMRHSNLTMLLEEGMGLTEVKEHAGHADIATTMIYTHFSVKKRTTRYHNALHGGLI